MWGRGTVGGRTGRAALVAGLLPGLALAGGLPLTESRAVLAVEIAGRPVVVERAPGALGGPAPLPPLAVAAGIATLGEAEVIAFLGDEVAAGTGLLADARLPAAFAAGSIPGALNLPAATVRPENPARAEILQALGATLSPEGGIAPEGLPRLVVFDDGLGDAAARQALSALAAAGWPVERLAHYRGGMRDWQAVGLTVARSGGG